MTGRTNFITDARWVDIWTIWYVLVDEAYVVLEQHYGAWRRRGPAPRFTDSEVITVALIIDTFFHGHEALGLAFVRQYHPTLFPHLPGNGQFNARRTVLGPLIDQIRQCLSYWAGLLDTHDRVRLIDSAPIPVATYGRSGSVQTVTGADYCGVMVSRKAKLFGLRVHLTATRRQVIDEWVLAPAAVHDSVVASALLAERTGVRVVGDNAYASPTLEGALRERGNLLAAPPRRNATAPGWTRQTRRWVNRLRRRIETALSVLVTVFDLERTGARSLSGLVSRISTRMLAYHLCFLMAPLLAQLQGI